MKDINWTRSTSSSASLLCRHCPAWMAVKTLRKQGKGWPYCSERPQTSPQECQQIMKDLSIGAIKATSHPSSDLKAAKEGVWVFTTESYVIHVHHDTNNTKERDVFALLPLQGFRTNATEVDVQFLFAVPARSLLHRSKKTNKQNNGHMWRRTRWWRY